MVAGHLSEKKGYYYAVLNYKDYTGKRKSKWVSTGLPVKGNKRRAEKILADIKRDFVPEEPKRIEASMLFSDYMESWLNIIKGSVAVPTYSSYSEIVNKNIIPYFRERKITLQGLTAKDIQAFYFHELQRVSASTVIHYHANIHKALKYAVKIDLIEVNPAAAATASVSAAASTPEDRPAQKKPGADGRRTEQTVAEPPALPEDWEQQVLAEWMAVTAVTQGESYAPADRNESFTLRLEKAEITGTVTVSFIRETYVSPQIQSAAETRTGELNAGALTRWDGEKTQGWNLTSISEDGRSRWMISMMKDGSLLMRSTGSKKDGTVWYVFRRTTAWDDIGYTAIPRRLWGTYCAGDEAAKGIRWMTFLPDGSCCMSVEWDGWSGILTGTADGTQGRTEDGTELHFTLTDTDGRPCEFWAILLNDDGSPSGCSLKYRAGEVLFDRDTRPVYWKNDSPDLTLVP